MICNVCGASENNGHKINCAIISRITYTKATYIPANETPLEKACDIEASKEIDAQDRARAETYARIVTPKDGKY